MTVRKCKIQKTNGRRDFKEGKDGTVVQRGYNDAMENGKRGKKENVTVDTEKYA